MHRFKYKKNHLFCEDVSVDRIAAAHGTPFYLYSHGTLIDHYIKIEKAFKSIKPLICFSMKANSNLAVLKTLIKCGSGLDIVSGGELYKALRVGCPSNRIVYASVGKRPDEIEEAIRKKIFLFNVESMPELNRINAIAGRMRKRVNLAIRLNPDIEAKTHNYITTGKSENKFGVGYKRAYQMFKDQAKYKNVKICGVHIHIGSQITQASPFVNAIKKTLEFMDSLDTGIEYFNIGGGMGIVYANERPNTAQQFADSVLPLLKGRTFKLILEPGRFIAGNSGILVTRVVYIKRGSHGKNFIIVDAGMNDLLRPSLYGAHHEIVQVNKPGRVIHRRIRSDVVGPICESGDFLAKNRPMPVVEEGDLLAIMGAGAYGFTMSSNYNSRPRIREILVVKDRAYIVREKETYHDLIRHERIPFGL